jgi:hypothetical protein
MKTMNKEFALDFLKKNKNMSIDAPQEDIDMFDKVRKFFIQNPDERCIILFLEAFGNHMGWGVFQLCDDVFNKYPTEKIVPHIKKCLKSENIGTRWWAAHWAMEFSNSEITSELIELAQSDIDVDAHYFALAALGEINLKSTDPNIIEYLKKRKSVENDSEIKELLNELI